MAAGLARPETIPVCRVGITVRNYLHILLPAALALGGCNGSGDSSASSARSAGSEPRLETDQQTLDDALLCTPFEHPDKPPVLLVHGTFTAGYEQYEWNYIPLLSAAGYDVCAVTYPDRGLGDMQVSAEYVVNALRSIYAQTGRKVAMVGHSQGAFVPRWAIKYWPSARNAVADFVLHAGPSHGTVIADPIQLLSSLGIPLPLPSGSASAPLLPAAFRQFPPDANFTTAMNTGDETPGDIDYTSLYTLTDELVQPATPVPTAALEYGEDNPHVANILMQDVCPLNIVDHVTIGTIDRVAYLLTLDAISNPGPANLERAGGAALCSNTTPIILDPALASSGVQSMLDILQRDAAAGLPDLHLTAAEPPLKDYAQENP
jgi:pimeloyl-ACP methyl ester carboxylesterase